MDVAESFVPWESDPIESFDDINGQLTGLFEKWVEQNNRLFAWRGVVNAAWPLHSSLYRRLLWTGGGAPPDEAALLEAETKVLKSVHRWGLHNGSRGRLSILSQLATLQHFGAPTRLIDVTLNAYIGLWFAVQPTFENGIPQDDGVDGRLYAIDITNRLINEQDDARDWEDALHRPWKRDDDDNWLRDWCSHTWAWRPPAFEARIAAQNGAFLFGGVPGTNLGIAWPKTSGAKAGSWRQDEVRGVVSIPLRFHKVKPRAGGVPRGKGQPAYTFRIKGDRKPEIRERLRALFGYQHSTIYPDFPGFASYAEPHLKTKE